MNAYESRVLNEIEDGIYGSDAAFAARMSAGPRLSTAAKVRMVAGALAGTTLVMMFSANLLLGLAGYLILVVVGTTVMRQRPIKPAQETPVEFFHRLTAGLLRDPGPSVEHGLDWE